MIIRILLLLTLIGFSSTTNAQTTDPSKLEVERIPYEYLVEADEFFRTCKGDFRYYNYYNCECLGSKFLDIRVKSGPRRSKSSILLDLENQCLDSALAAGSQYLDCMDNGALFPKGKDPVEYCECYGRAFGEEFEKLGQQPSTTVLVHVKSKAELSCR